MTTTVTTARSGPYTAAAQTTFSVTFQSLSADEIAVYVDDVLINAADYTFTRDDDGTGELVFDSAQTGEVLIVSAPSYQQPTEFAQHGAFYPNQINTPLDRQARTLLAVRDEVETQNDIISDEVAARATLAAEFASLQAALPENIRDTIGAALIAGTNVTITPNDAGDTITISSADTTDPEVVRDTMATALVAGANVTITPSDAGDTITIEAASAFTDPEVVRDTMATALVAGSNVTITPNDAGDTITIAATVDQEIVRDTVAATLVAGANVTLTVDDVADTITIASSGGGGGGGLGDGNYGDITVGGTGTTMTINNNVVTFAKLQDIPANSFLGNNTGVAADAIAMTPAQAKTLLAIGAADVSGLGAMATSTDAANLSGTLPAARLPAFAGGDVTSAVGTVTLTLGPGAVTLAKMAQLPAETIIGNNTALDATPIALSRAQFTNLLNTFTDVLKGAVPASGGGTANFLRADGSWAAPSASGTTTNALTISDSGGAAAGTTFNGSVARTIDYNTVGAAAKFLNVVTSSANLTLTDTHNNSIINGTGATNRTITLGSGPSAGMACDLKVTGTGNRTLSCAGGMYKNGAATTSTSGTVASGGFVSLIHIGSGVWFASGTGLT